MSESLSQQQINKIRKNCFSKKYSKLVDVAASLIPHVGNIATQLTEETKRILLIWKNKKNKKMNRELEGLTRSHLWEEGYSWDGIRKAKVRTGATGIPFRIQDMCESIK